MIKDAELDRLNSSALQPAPVVDVPRLVPLVWHWISRRQVLLFTLDGLIAGIIPYLVANRNQPSGEALAILPLAIIALVHVGILNLRGFYNPKRIFPFYQRAYELFKATCISLLLISALFYLLPTVATSRRISWDSGILILGSLILWRTLYHKLLPLPSIYKRVLIVGAGESGRHIAQEIKQNRSLGYDIVGFMDDDSQKLGTVIEGVTVLDRTDYLPETAKRHQVDAIILAITHHPREAAIKAVGDCIELGCEVLNVASLSERLSGRIPVRHIKETWFISELNVANRKLYEVAKRMLDVTLSLLGLAVTALLLPPLAILIKLDSPGPVIYSQFRVGKNGKHFKIYKFRTMVQDAEKTGAVWAQRNDRRITPIGNFLRRSRLDELPQLYNILKGEMSLVGPRPERPEFVELLADQIPFYQRRHMVLPGLTGWAQVRFPYGASIEDALEKLQYDLFYIKNRSLFLDLEILLRTVGTVIRKTGAR